MLKETCSVPFIFRAGVWKPRTRPDTFQGAGEEGLRWLSEVKAQYGIPVATEVATPEHVSAALEAGMDYLWIGARSSATPIVVQSLADSICDLKIRRFEDSKIRRFEDLKGLFIKNPVNADAALWLGNIERLEQTGVPVMAVHRGCGHKPSWSVAHEVRLARPDIPMLLDPSHMSGDAAKVPELLAKVTELGLDGAMIEVHCCPEKALSDAKQQIRPSAISRQLSAVSHQNTVELNWLRAEIDELDETLWETVAARMDVSRRIGEWKKAHGVAPLQPERYQQIKSKVESQKSKAFSADFALRLWEIIHEESVRIQVKGEK